MLAPKLNLAVLVFHVFIVYTVHMCTNWILKVFTICHVFLVKKYAKLWGKLNYRSNYFAINQGQSMSNNKLKPICSNIAASATAETTTRTIITVTTTKTTRIVI